MMTEVVEKDFLDLFRHICHAQDPFRASILDDNIIGRFANKDEEIDFNFVSGSEAESCEEVFNSVVELVVGGKGSVGIFNGGKKPIIWERVGCP